MQNHSSAIMIAAPKSGSGKTLLTCALLQALKNRKLNVQAFKCGPDYIDPMFHRQIIDVASKNLDPFFSDDIQLQALFEEGASDRNIAVLEGAMGLYDGLGGISEEASAYHIAKTLHIPIILVVDAHGMGRSVIPLLAGFLQYDSADLICGVILNRTSAGFFKSVAPVIERELSLPVIGYFPNQPELHLESRHLGLKLPEEIADLHTQTQQAAKVLEECVQIDRLLGLAEKPAKSSRMRHKPKNNLPGSAYKADREPVSLTAYKEVEDGVRIAVAKDEAFCFYYEDNLRCLERAGAKLVFFSPLHDEALPENIGGIVLGGGYPELYAPGLSKNESMRRSIKNALDADMPSLAECGGFMYLHEHLIQKDGSRYEMCGVLPADCYDTGKLVRFGYISLEEKSTCFLGKNETIPGHEFHYFNSSANGSDCLAVKPVTGRQWECTHVTGRHWWGFPHLYYLSNENFVRHFIEEARETAVDSFRK